MPSRYSDDEKLQMLARYNAANGEHPNPKVTKLKAPRASKTKAPVRAYQKPLTAKQYRDRMVEAHKLAPLKKAEGLSPYDVTNVTRYPAVPLFKDMAEERLQRILSRHAYSMNEHGISPVEFKLWREHVMYMTPEQLGAFVRVNERTIRNWENGTSEIPFSMWWMMSSTLQDPEYFLTRPGFHDFYIDYDRATGEPLLCSASWPDIRVSPTDLWVQRAATGKCFTLETRIQEKQCEVDELRAENTRLRQMLKAGTVASELASMHAHIGNLLERMHTADVVDFPTAGGEVRQFAQAAG